MMKNLERDFGSTLFSEVKGELVPGAFAERLYNDLRFLNAARQRMSDHITAIHENGRILHVGCSPGVFRTREFRNLFRGLQDVDGIRASYAAVEPGGAAKALVSGHCDLFLGCWGSVASRFMVEDAGPVSFRIHRRGQEGTRENETGPIHAVSLDGQLPEPLFSYQGRRDWKALDEIQWLYWLDHPERCPLGTVVFGPDVEMDPEYWHRGEAVPTPLAGPALQASFLRQHPYEFLPSLIGRVCRRILIS